LVPTFVLVATPTARSNADAICSARLVTVRGTDLCRKMVERAYNMFITIITETVVARLGTNNDENWILHSKNRHRQRDSDQTVQEANSATKKDSPIPPN
jgi:hypothetical protein